MAQPQPEPERAATVRLPGIKRITDDPSGKVSEADLSRELKKRDNWLWRVQNWHFKPGWEDVLKLCALTNLNPCQALGLECEGPPLTVEMIEQRRKLEKKQKR